MMNVSQNFTEYHEGFLIRLCDNLLHSMYVNYVRCSEQTSICLMCILLFYTGMVTSRRTPAWIFQEKVVDEILSTEREWGCLHPTRGRFHPNQETLGVILHLLQGNRTQYRTKRDRTQHSLSGQGETP